MTAREIYQGSDGEATKRYYAALETHGALGQIAMNLFRAQKCSSRAKLYRGCRYKDAAYGRKEWSIDQLADALSRSPVEMTHGWKQDPSVLFGERASWVFYVELPNGQVSFHSPSRGKGPDFAGEWDQAKRSEERILDFCDAVMEGRLPVRKLAEIPASRPAPVEQIGLFAEARA